MPRLRELVASLEPTGASLTVVAPGRPPLRVGTGPERTRVVLRTSRAERLLERGDQLSLAQAYIDGHLDVEGDFDEVLRVLDVLPGRPAWPHRLVLWARLTLPGRGKWAREAIAFHYDRPAEFFLPWFERWRSYSHGFYRDAGDTPETAQERKLACALAVQRLPHDGVVLDVGAGWGSFVEFAGRQGVRVHGITVSHAQCRFVEDLIRRENLPCTIEYADLRRYRPRQRFEGAVLLGSLEHLPDYDRVARFLDRHLTRTARVYADFCSQEGDEPFGAFVRTRVWPGPTTLVNPARLVRAFARVGLRTALLVDDTHSYACTCRDWAVALDRVAAGLSARFGEPAVRTFRLLLRASAWFFAQGRIRAHHLVAER